MQSTPIPSPLQNALDCLQGYGIPISPIQIQLLLDHAQLVQKANRLLHLVSQNDAENIPNIHTLDALRLIPVLHARPNIPNHLDIGPGGGFPALPIAILLPYHIFTLIERSAKKFAFLTKTIAQLRLKNIHLINEPFPTKQPIPQPTTLTARAIETPDKILPNILNILEINSTFICQTNIQTLLNAKMFHVEQFQPASSPNHPTPPTASPKMFHVEQFPDPFQEFAPARSLIHLIQRTNK